MNRYIYFLESNFVGVNRLFALVYTNGGKGSIRSKSKIYYLPKVIIKIIM